MICIIMIGGYGFRKGQASGLDLGATFEGRLAELVAFRIRAWKEVSGGHCQTNWPGAEEAIIEDSQAAS